jgi:hypothetical protein
MHVHTCTLATQGCDGDLLGKRHGAVTGDVKGDVTGDVTGDMIRTR